MLLQLLGLQLLAACVMALLAELGDIKNLHMIPKRALDQTNLLKVAANTLYSTGNFESKDNIIACEDTGTVIFHSSKLDTASRTGGNLFGTHTKSKATKDTWYEVRSGTATELKGPRLPLTGCLHMHQGDGGLLTGSFSKNLGKTSSFDLQYAFTMGMLKNSLDYNLGIATSVTVSGDYSCDVPANTTGQMFIQPFLLQIENCELRELTVGKRPSVSKPGTKKVLGVKFGDWNSHASIRVPASGTKPIFSCVTDPQMLMCGSNVLGDTWAVT